MNKLDKTKEKRTIKVVFGSVLAVFLSACTSSASFGEVLSALKDSASVIKAQQEALEGSEYPEFTKAYIAKLPELKESITGGFIGGYEGLKVTKSGIQYRLDEFKEEATRGNYDGGAIWSKQKRELLDKYLLSDFPENNIAFKSFIETSKELGLHIKKYQPHLWAFLAPHIYFIGRDSDIKHLSMYRDIDYIYIAYDKNNAIKAIFSYAHEFGFYQSNGSVKHQAIYAELRYGVNALRVSRAIRDEIFEKYEVKSF